MTVRILDHIYKRLDRRSMDGPEKGRLGRFLLSARLGLWPAIVLSCFAFHVLLQYSLLETEVLALSLCAIASVGFLFNDILDRKIDLANNVHRWSIRARVDCVLFALAILVLLTALVFAYTVLTSTAFKSLLVTTGLVFAYSLFAKRMLLIGNSVAAGLSVTPGLIMTLDTRFSQLPSASPDRVSAAIFLLCSAFLMLLSREIKFDEFDKAGDRAGRRLTLPMLIGVDALAIVHFLLVVTGAVMISTAIYLYGSHSYGGNLAISALTAILIAALSYPAYRSRSKTLFYKLTRIVMLIVPISILASF